MLTTALLLSLAPLNFQAKWLTTPSNARLRSLNVGQTGRSKHPSCMVMDHMGRKSFAASGMGRKEVVAVELLHSMLVVKGVLKEQKEVELHIKGIVVPIDKVNRVVHQYMQLRLGPWPSVMVRQVAAAYEGVVWKTI